MYEQICSENDFNDFHPYICDMLICILNSEEQIVFTREFIKLNEHKRKRILRTFLRGSISSTIYKIVLLELKNKCYDYRHK